MSDLTTTMTDEAPMQRVRFVDHDGVRILHADYSGIRTTEELREWVDRASELIRECPPRSALVLVNLEGVPYNLENLAVLREAVQTNRPYVLARAVYGLPSIAQLSFGAMARVSGRRMERFRDADSAIRWLRGLVVDP